MSCGQASVAEPQTAPKRKRSSPTKGDSLNPGLQEPTGHGPRLAPCLTLGDILLGAVAAFFHGVLHRTDPGAAGIAPKVMERRSKLSGISARLKYPVVTRPGYWTGNPPTAEVPMPSGTNADAGVVASFA